MFKRWSDLGQEAKISLFTIRATDVRLKPPHGIFVKFDPKSNPEVITSAKERKIHGEKSDSSWFKSRLSAVTVYDYIANHDHPLEVATADICPILKIGGQRYLVSFLRDIWPEGWLIPGGCPQNPEELLISLEATAQREFFEELIIANNQTRIPYRRGFGIHEIFSKNILDYYKLKCSDDAPCLLIEKTKPVPGQAEQLLIESHMGFSQIANVNVTVDPVTASLAITSYWEIDLGDINLSQLCLCDGEELSNGALIDRYIRLTQQNKIAALFRSGRNIPQEEWADHQEALSADWLSPSMAARCVDPCA